MAPKPAAKAPAKPPAKSPTAPAKKDAPAADAPAAPTAAANQSGLSPPKNKEEVLAQVNLDGLPHCPNEQIIEIIKERYETLVSVFIHYSKQSECKTIEQGSRLRLGAPSCRRTRMPLVRHLWSLQRRPALSHKSCRCAFVSICCKEFLMTALLSESGAGGGWRGRAAVSLLPLS